VRVHVNWRARCSSHSLQNNFRLSVYLKTTYFVPNMLVPKLTFMFRSGLYRYFVCTESDCTDIDIQCTKTGCTEKTCTESVCTEIVLYRKRPTPCWHDMAIFRANSTIMHFQNICCKELHTFKFPNSFPHSSRFGDRLFHSSLSFWYNGKTLLTFAMFVFVVLVR